MKLLKKSTETPDKASPLYTDLRQVMDYTRDFSMFYSGVEYEVYLDGCYDMGVRNFLMSYEYLRGKGASSIKKHPDMHLFIDSGAFTYMNDPKYAEYTVEQWEEQIHAYLKWAEGHKESIFAMAELDLQNMLGIDTIQRWRRDFFEPFMLRTGIPVCFIYHHEGESTWEKMCERYPFVGFSAVSDDGTTYDLDGFRSMLRVAEKYNSLVHGFGMTRTSVLPELPYYTVDSTSWKAGFRYGQIAIWNGKKVQMFRKDDFDTKVVPIIRSYPDLKLDEDLLMQYYEPEILRANVYAYQKAEEFIIERQKPLTYWKKSKTVKVDIDSLQDDFFPPVDWFYNGSREGMQEYAQKMNINPEYSDLYNLLFDTTTFSTWGNPDYQKMHDWYLEEKQEGLIEQLHDTYINRIVSDREARIEDLKKFFLDCIAGNNDKLLQLGTNFDRLVKEREAYLEEEDEELVDLSESEVKTRLRAILPAPADGESDIDPEIALDAEIYREAGIIPSHDSNGLFVKGQVSVRKPKKVYSQKYPKFACDTCYAAAKCPEYKAGYVCAYHKMFSRFDTRDMADIIQSMQGMVEHNLTRMQRAMVMEVINGTVDPQVTAFIDQNMRLMNHLKQMYEYGSPEVLRQTRVIRADGTREETTSITNPQGGGILEKLFGNFNENNKNRESMDDLEVIEVEAKDIPPEEVPKKNDRYNESDEEYK